MSTSSNLTSDSKVMVLKLPRLYPKQKAAVFSPLRYSVIEASTKAGKTVGCMVWIIAQAWSTGKPGRNYWWVAPIYPVARIAMNRIIRMLRRIDPQKSIWSYNKSESWVELKSGGRIWFKGSDNPDSLYGEDVHAAVVDEASRCKEDAWHAVRSTLTATKGPVRIIGNVRGRKNWAFKLARKAQAGAEGMAYFKITAYDAAEGGVLDYKEIEDAKATLPKHVFDELYKAEPADDGGNPFGLAAIADCAQEDLAPGPAVCWGVDLAKSQDWTVIVGLNADGKICMIDRWQAPWNITSLRLRDMLGDAPALIDMTGVGDPIVEGLQSEVGNIEGFRFTSVSKQMIMNGLAAAIQTGAIGILNGWLRDEVESFEYQYSASGVKYSAPAGLHDDGVCALALAWHKFGGIGRQTPVQAAWIGGGYDEDDD